MPDIGVRELKAKASEILKEIREQRARYVITFRGKPIATLQPVEKPEDLAISPASETSKAWDELERLGEKIAQGWVSEKDSLEILTELRR
ncbi:MAG: hypothetical protein A2Z14_01145 [Chloroflexi bacterium RBG_16_48_8]|nr:MAG: hypothetical protein A2Z14_01145 [Chloroflexi bacterium RBG_16_48_8]